MRKISGRVLIEEADGRRFIYGKHPGDGAYLRFASNGLVPWEEGGFMAVLAALRANRHQYRLEHWRSASIEMDVAESLADLSRLSASDGPFVVVSGVGEEEVLLLGELVAGRHPAVFDSGADLADGARPFASFGRASRLAEEAVRQSLKPASVSKFVLSGVSKIIGR